MSEKAGNAAIDLLLANYTDEPTLSFYGGEPLLRSSFVLDQVERLRGLTNGNQVRVVVDTNFAVGSRQTIAKLVELGVNFQVSLDGPRSVHDHARIDKSGRGTFKQVTSNLGFVRQLSPSFYETNVYFSTTITPPYDLTLLEAFFNQPEYRENVVVASFVEGDRDLLDIVYPGYSSTFSKIRDRRRSYVRSVAQRGGEGTGRIEKSLFMPQLRKMASSLRCQVDPRVLPSNGICVPGARKLYVDTEGLMYPCESLKDRFCVGSVFEGLCEDKIREFVASYQAACRSACIGCSAVRFCSKCYIYSKPLRPGVLGLTECVGERRRVQSTLQDLIYIREHCSAFFEELAQLEGSDA